MYGPVRRHLLVPLLILVLLWAPAAAFAAPSAGAIADKQAEAKRAQSEMKRMQSELSAGVDEYVKVSGDLERTRAEIEVNGRRLRKLEQRLALVETRLGGRADFIYRTRDTGTLDVLFSAASFDEFLTRFDVLARIASEDAGLIAEAKRGRAQARALRASLKDRERRLVALRDKSATEKSQLESSLSKQRTYFSSLSADVAALLKARERAAQPPPATTGGRPAPKAKSGNGLAVATVTGRDGSYYVMSDEPVKYRPTGVGMSTQASQYSVAENGHGTSSGRSLDDNELTCAHKTLPLGTRVAITRGGRRVICIVTDRGPFSPPGRDLDLTVRAASILGIDGVGNVQYEVVVPAS